MKSKSLDIKSLTSELRNISKGSGDSGQRIIGDPGKKTYPDRSKVEPGKNKIEISHETKGKSTIEFLELIDPGAMGRT